jgi:hypothetical protein
MRTSQIVSLAYAAVPILFAVFVIGALVRASSRGRTGRAGRVKQG